MRAVTCILFLACLCRAQEAPPIKVEVNLVNVAASVRDRQGKLVQQLVKEDFELLEDGVEQRIQLFARNVDLPLTLGLLVDFSGSQGEFIKKHRRDLETFLENVLGPKDRVFVIGFGNQLRLIRDFTSSAGEVMEHLKLYEKGSRRYEQVGPQVRRVGGSAFYDAIYHGVEKLGPETGRKALVIFSDGEDNASAYHMIDAIEASQTADVLLYNVRYTQVSRGEATARNIYGTRVMRRISADTGGADFDASDSDPKAAFRQIEQELRSLYELAFVSRNAARDGSFRKIQVRVKQPDLAARTKSGYYAR